MWNTIKGVPGNIATCLFGNPRLGISLFFGTIVMYYLIWRQAIMLGSRFNFMLLDIQENIQFFRTDSKIRTGWTDFRMHAYLIGLDVMIIATASLSWYFEYREICLVGRRQSALTRKGVQFARICIYTVWFFIILLQCKPAPWMVTNCIMAVLNLLVILQHIKIFFMRTPPEFKISMENVPTWAQYFGLENNEDEDEDDESDIEDRRRRRRTRRKRMRHREARRHREVHDGQRGAVRRSSVSSAGVVAGWR